MKNIKYTEPKSYFPKNVRDQYFGKKTTAKKATTTKKPAPKKK